MIKEYRLSSFVTLKLLLGYTRNFRSINEPENVIHEYLILIETYEVSGRH